MPRTKSTQRIPVEPEVLTANTLNEYFEFEVSLRNVPQRIWRRFLLRRTATFQDLHDAVQAACGWNDYHLFQFVTAGDEAMPLACSEHLEEPDAPVASAVPLTHYFTGAPGERCRYDYDFGDGWEYNVVVKGLVRLTDGGKRSLLAGARAFPPEDCGGIGGYERIVEYLRTGTDPWDEPEIVGQWLGTWDPEKFDIEAVRANFDL